MNFRRALVAVVVGTVLVASACASASPMSEDLLAECTVAAGDRGTIGGSSTLLSGVVRWLPDGFPDTEGMSPDEVEVAFNATFEEAYGISVDDFLALRDDADATTTALLGEPPSSGEMVGDEWFDQRDVELMRLWNERHPESAKAFCGLVGPSG